MINRRKFLKNGALAGMLAGAVGMGQSNELSAAGLRKQEEADIPDAGNFELNELTIQDLQKKMQSGIYTSRSITTLYLKRIDAIDKNGYQLRSVIELNPDALSIADGLDRERKQGRLRGPLHGIPVLIKDNIDTADKMMNTAGSLALQGNRPVKDAFIIQQLRAAGAVILGKTNLSEWANFRSTRSSSGWSSRGGQTKNPCVLDRNPCGSSSGSAVAVAANLCVVAVGTETDGSITAPASFCGIVGIKPTVGLLSRSGIIPISATQDTAGPMARTVTDAAILMAAMRGVDPSDAVTTKGEALPDKNYITFLKADALSGKRIGIEKSFLKGNANVVALYQQAIDIMRSKGATVIEIELLKETSKLGEAEYNVLLYEFKDGVNKYLSAAHAGVKSLTDVIAFNKANEKSVMPFFKQETLERSEAKGDLKSEEYIQFLAKSASSKKIIDDLLLEHRLDAIAGTTIGPANCIDHVNGDYGTGFYFAPPAAMAGYPHITVPMGQVFELPVGLSFIAGAYREPELLGIAYAFEQASQKRVAPKFLKTVSV
jgi:amidase